MTRIGIIGAGPLGESLATLSVQAGHRVQLANSRGPATLSSFAARTGACATDLSKVGAEVDVLVLAIPMHRIADLPPSTFAALAPQTVVVDAGNYYPLREGFIGGLDDQEPESVWVQGQIGVPVAKAFNSIIAAQLLARARPTGDPQRVALPVCADGVATRRQVQALIDSLGFDGSDAGPLSDSWRQEPGEPAYCTDPTAAELPSLLARADRDAARRHRDEAVWLLNRLPADYPSQRLVDASRFMAGLDRGRPTAWLSTLHVWWSAQLNRKPRP